MGFGTTEVIAGAGKSLCYWGKRVGNIPAAFVPRKRSQLVAPPLPVQLPQMNAAQKGVLEKEKGLEKMLHEQHQKLIDILAAQKEATKNLEQQRTNLGSVEVQRCWLGRVWEMVFGVGK